jgi:hypothetical protein
MAEAGPDPSGLPVGSRTPYLMVEAGSQDELDHMLRDLPAWGVFLWEATPLQILEGRAAMERRKLGALKAKGNYSPRMGNLFRKTP